MDHVSKEFSEVARIGREAERRQIAHELQHALGQALVAVLLNIQGFLNDCQPMANNYHPAQHLRTGYRDLVQRLSRVGASIEDGAVSVSRVLHHLRPIIVEHLGLEPAIQKQCRESMSDKIRIWNFGGLRQKEIPPDAWRCLYRIAQEALHNIIKQGQFLVHGILDHGIRCNPEQTRWNTELGMGSMQERAQSANGKFASKTGFGQGTEITVQGPLHHRKAHAYASCAG